MDESMRTKPALDPRPVEFSNALHGFGIVGSDGERIGTVADISVSRMCVRVDTSRRLFQRKQSYAVHVGAVREIDLDRFRISLAASKDEVAGAPAFRELDADCEAAIAGYYAGLA